MSKHNDVAPRWGERFLKMVLSDPELETILGDLAEIYTENVQTRSGFRVHLWYTLQVLKSAWRGVSVSVWWGLSMLGSYVKGAWRNFKRHLVTSVINMAGLTIGLAGCILMLLWIGDEIRYDRFHERAEHLYRVVNSLDYGPVAQETYNAAFPLGPALKDEIPEVVDTARLLPVRRLLITHGDKRFYESNFVFADPSFFEMFTFPFLRGDPETALDSPTSLVITRDTALKYFGDADPIGRTLLANNQNPYTVSGVIENIPQTSHIRFDFMGSLKRAVSEGARTHWSGWFYRTYVQLAPDVDLRALNTKLEAWIATQESEASVYSLQPLTDSNLYGIGGRGKIRSLSLFSFLAFLVLLVACINYMNLSSARAGCRAKEIGLRKVVGARKANVVRQFLSESIVSSLIALFAAVLLVLLFLPVFNRLAGKELGLESLGSSSILLGILGITVFTGLLAGSYPAFFLASFQPERILKTASPSRKTGSGSAYLRKTLVVVQFIISIFLIICTTLLYRQMDFIRTNGLGFDTEQVVYVPLKSQGNLWERYNADRIWSMYTALKQALHQNPYIMSVAAATGLPFGPMGSEFGQLDWPGKEPETNIEMHHMAVDPGFAETLGLEMVGGRFLSDETGSETQGFVLNQAAVRVIGLEEPLGKPFRLLDKSGVIIGVIRDFHYASLRTEINPLVLHAMPYQYWSYRNFVLLRLKPGNLEKTLASLEETWDRVIPEYPFEFQFLDQDVAEAYGAEQRLEAILRIFTFLAIFISCFGLFGLISFTAELRTKEIGIRKVMGASVPGIVRLLSKEFVVLVALANLIAWPAAYIVMNAWLENFAYRINIGLLSFLLSGVLALVIAVLTIGYQSIKAATADPVVSLRYE